MRAALVNEDDFAVGVESVLDHERHLERPGPAGPAREVNDRIALGRRRDSGCARHEDTDTAPVGLGPILEHCEVATLTPDGKSRSGKPAMLGWGHGIVWKDAARVDSLGGLLVCVVAHAAIRHSAASTTQFFAALITLASPFKGCTGRAFIG